MQISKYEFSWAGKLVALTILPQLLYMFRSLPIPCSYLNSCVGQACLIRHRSMGSSGLVDIMDYYHSTVLSQLKDWFLPEAHSLWGDLEHHSIPSTNMKLWLCALPKHLPPTILASFKMWHLSLCPGWILLGLP